MVKAAPDISAIELDESNQNNGNMENTVADAEIEQEDKKSSSDPKSGANNVASAKADPDIHLDHLCQDISHFAASLCGIDKSQPLETPKYLDDFLDTIESKLQYYESSSPSLGEEDSSLGDFLKAVDHLVLLIDSVSRFKSFSNSAAILLNLATSQLHRAMLILGDELALLLHKRDCQVKPEGDDCALPDEEEAQQQQQQQPQPQQEQNAGEAFPPFSSEDISIMSSVAKTMILAGYMGECNRLFLITRRCAFEEELASQGFEKMSIDDAQRMQWETLEAEISTWIRVFKGCTTRLFPGELKFHQAIFSQLKPPNSNSNSKPIWMVLFDDIASSVIHQLVNLAHAVAMTQRSSEKLFKFLDMHETLQDLGSWLEEFTDDDCILQELRSELAAASSRLGQAAVSIFCELKASIASDNKQPGACGSIHPLTSSTMNYLNSACKYKGALEELFLRHLNTSNSDEDQVDDATSTRGGGSTPFTAQLMSVMDLLDANLEAKSTVYKDPSLRYIFLMNNLSYMLQEIKGSKEMHKSLGNTWCRKGSTELRSYHKNYQRDTWTKVLQCLVQEGLVVNGKVEKPVLKERFKNFNQLFEEIHKTQSVWVVSDEQLQSELRVSISAVMIPAYRGFLGRFGQIFTPGSQDEKHVKYQAEDIEAAIDELFDGAST